MSDSPPVEIRRRTLAGDAEDARFAAASLARVRAAVAALDAQLVRGDTGERWVLDQITRAIEET